MLYLKLLQGSSCNNLSVLNMSAMILHTWKRNLCQISFCCDSSFSLTTSSVVLFYCSGGPTEWGILGDVVHDTIPGLGLRLHRLGLEEISGDQRWLSLGNAVLETGVAQICHEGFSITVADTDSCLAAPWLSWLRLILMVLDCLCYIHAWKGKAFWVIHQIGII